MSNENILAKNIKSLGSVDGSGKMFDQIAKRYDLLNKIISFGMDKSWRRKLVKSLPENGEVLDVATGTGDVAIEVASAYPNTKVVGLDPSVNMLAQGEIKVANLNLEDRIKLVKGDALDLPFENDRFAGACVSFGVRNFPDRLKGLKEINRVTAKGGVITILELSDPETGFLNKLSSFYLRAIVPKLGALFSLSSEYRYLQKSIEAFPAPLEFKKIMKQAGIENITISRMPFGVAYLYVGRANK